MRARLILLVTATTSLVLVAFLVPLALLVRATAADRAVSGTFVQMQALAPLVSTVDAQTLELAVARANAGNRHQMSVFLPNGRIVGAEAARSPAVSLAATGRSFNTEVPGGREVLVAVGGLSEGTAVIRAFISDAELQHGVGRSWAVLGLLGLGLLVVSVLVTRQLARNLTRPLTAAAQVSHRLAQGDLSARAEPTGPPEVRQVSAGLNLLAGRIDELLAGEREMVADLSHRLRTPLTALRIDVESLRDPDDRLRIGADLDAVQRMVDAIIREARRPVRHDVVATCTANETVAERVQFWSALAADEGRPVAVDLTPDPVPVRVSADDLAACLDAVLGNVFAHTPERCGMRVSLARRSGGGGVLVVSDDGPGMPDPSALRRGHSGSGSTGLGLDIVRRVAADSGGSLSLGTAPDGGTTITVEFGAPPPGTS